MGCPDIWLNSIRGMSEDVININFGIGVNNSYVPPGVDSHHPIHGEAEWYKRRRQVGFALPGCLSWGIYLLLMFLILRDLELDCKLHHQLPSLNLHQQFS